MPKPLDRRVRQREHDQRRGSARERGYTHRWDKARKSYLQSHPLCAFCSQDDRITAATVVDHIIPHRGDQALFWDQANWQPLCAPCHNSAKKREEAGTMHVVDEDGWPRGLSTLVGSVVDRSPRK